MAEPYEVILSPVEAYWAPVGESVPAIDAAPAGNWQLVGKAGSLNRSPDGLRITASQEIIGVAVDGSAFPVKEGRDTEGLVVALTLFDMTLESLRLSFNLNAVSTVAGPPARKEMSLERGSLVQSVALLIRFPSPYNDALNAHYALYKCGLRGTSEITHRRTEPAGISLEFSAQVDTSRSAGDRVGKLICQTA
jgi:hypothetical protein